MAQGSYRIKFILSNLENAQRRIIFQDTYLRTQTEVSANGTTPIDFSITADPASSKPDKIQGDLFLPDQKPVFPCHGTHAVKMVIVRTMQTCKWNVTDEDDVTDWRS